MKKKTLIVIFFLASIISYSQVFKSGNDDFINIDSRDIKIKIDNTNYKGQFETFTSKKDKQEYLIYNYFSRTIVIELNQNIDEIDENSPNLIINTVKLIHTSDLNSLKKAISKKGLDGIKDFITISQASNMKLDLINQNLHIL